MMSASTYIVITQNVKSIWQAVSADNLCCNRKDRLGTWYLDNRTLAITRYIIIINRNPFLPLLLSMYCSCAGPSLGLIPVGVAAHSVNGMNQIQGLTPRWDGSMDVLLFLCRWKSLCSFGITFNWRAYHSRIIVFTFIIASILILCLWPASIT